MQAGNIAGCMVGQPYQPVGDEGGACRERVVRDDLEDVRKALGYPRWNLWGGSYGTRAALEYLRSAGITPDSSAFVNRTTSGFTSRWGITSSASPS